MVEYIDTFDELYYDSYKYPESVKMFGRFIMTIPLVAGLIAGLLHAFFITARGNFERVCNYLKIEKDLVVVKKSIWILFIAGARVASQFLRV